MMLKLKQPPRLHRFRQAAPYVASALLVGVAIVVFVLAAGPLAIVEVENGVIGNGAVRVSLPGASGGLAIQFAASAPSTPSPTPRPTVTPTATPRPTSTPTPAPNGSLTATDLTRLAKLKIFFGHQSVGANILQGIPEIYSSYGVSSPTMISTTSLAGRTGGYFADAMTGNNGEPMGKNTAFSLQVHGGVGNQVNVAFFKYCYVDITSNTNVTTLFAGYKAVMASLVQSYPNVKFIYVTNPLTTNDAADNTTRERFNSMMRQEYGSTGRLFDLAAVESTAPNGTRVQGTHGGSTYYSMYSGYTTDGGHLNAAGRQAAAKQLLTVLANVTR